jgi:hypothetical protein
VKKGNVRNFSSELLNILLLKIQKAIFHDIVPNIFASAWLGAK